ncbi:MAG: ABC transporter permease [Candidatus Micrarchaeota archaeon]|nr:ABC transporter permease [Candidatus Micrarchaeota archaeon]
MSWPRSTGGKEGATERRRGADSRESMKLEDIAWLSFKDLREKKVRTALTVLMVMIGVASIVALTSQTAGISASISKSLSALGPTSVIVMPAGGTGFTAADVGSLSSLPNVSAVIPVIEGSGTVYANGQNTSVSVIGISQEGLREFVGGNVSMYQGVLYNDTVAPDALIGHSIAFPSSLSGRQNVMVNYPISLKVDGGRSAQTLTVPVVGILNAVGSSVVPTDTSVFFSIQSAQVILHRTSYNLIIVKATNTSSVAALSSLISTIYGNRANVITTQQLLQTASSIIGSISLLFAIIAGVSLLVAAIGIMNIMLIAVYERTHEIGIFKSVGFTGRHILLVFLSQAMIIGFIGGVIGIGAGMGASYVVASVFAHAGPSGSGTTGTGAQNTQFKGGGGGVYVSSGGGPGRGGDSGAAPSSSSSSSLSYSPVFTPSTVLAALLVAMVVSMIAGIYPAWRASKMEPIDALREL